MNDGNCDEAVLDHLSKIAPEQMGRLQQLKDLGLNFRFVSDGPGFRMDASAEFKTVFFSQRTLTYLWLMGWVLWKEMYVWASFLNIYLKAGLGFDLELFTGLHGQDQATEEADKVYADAFTLLEAGTPQDCRWPLGVPKPEDIPNGSKEDGVVNDFVYHASGFCMLHEIRHVLVGIDGLSFEDDRNEELECDRWASDYMLENVLSYAATHDEDAIKVQSKRAIGIILGIVVAAHAQSLEIWEEGARHPPIATRLANVTNGLTVPDTDLVWNVACSFLLAALRHKNALPNRIAARNERELFEKLLSISSANGASGAVASDGNAPCQRLNI